MAKNDKTFVVEEPAYEGRSAARAMRVAGRIAQKLGKTWGVAVYYDDGGCEAHGWAAPDES